MNPVLEPGTSKGNFITVQRLGKEQEYPRTLLSLNISINLDILVNLLELNLTTCEQLIFMLICNFLPEMEFLNFYGVKHIFFFILMLF